MQVSLVQLHKEVQVQNILSVMLEQWVQIRSGNPSRDSSWTRARVTSVDEPTGTVVIGFGHWVVAEAGIISVFWDLFLEPS